MLRAKYVGGSSLFLDNPNDIDYFYYYDTHEERIEGVINNKERVIDIHFVEIANATKIRLDCYTYPFMKLIEGDEIEELKKFSIFKHEDEYKDLLRKYVFKLNKDCKLWYHILIAVYMFENRKMKLTKAQLKNVQKVHDEKCINDELYNYIVEKLA